MIPCASRHCLICHPLLLVKLPPNTDPQAFLTAMRVLIACIDEPYVVVPEGTRIEPIADLPVPAPADRC